MNKKKSKHKKARPDDFVAWARRATAGIDQSTSMIGIVDWTKSDRDSDRYWTFAIQLGRCLLEGKPLLLIVPTGTEVPERLRLAASAVEFYVDGDDVSVTAACKRAFESIGVFVKH
jgi:hypothetical protein